MDFLASPGVEDPNLQPNGTGSRFDVPQRGLCGRCVGRIDEHGYTSGGGDEVTQEVQPLRRQLAADKVDARRVATRPVKAGDKTKFDRVFGEREDNGDTRGCRLGREPPHLRPCATYR